MKFLHKLVQWVLPVFNVLMAIMTGLLLLAFLAFGNKLTENSEDWGMIVPLLGAHLSFAITFFCRLSQRPSLLDFSVRSQSAAASALVVLLGDNCLQIFHESRRDGRNGMPNTNDLTGLGFLAILIVLSIAAAWAVRRSMKLAGA